MSEGFANNKPLGLPDLDWINMEEWLSEPNRPGLWEFRHPQSPGWRYHYEVTAGGEWLWRETFAPQAGAYSPPPRGFRGGEWRWISEAPAQ